MLELILWGSLSLVAVIILLILAPLVYIIPLKLKFGEKAVLRYFPILGFEGLLQNSFLKKHDSYGFAKEIVRGQPNVKFILTNMLHKPAITFLDHTYGKQIILEHHNYNKYEVFMDHRLFNKGLIFTRGQKWKQQRNMLTQSFSFEKLKKLVPLFNQITREYLQIIDFNAFKPLNHLSMITGEVIIRSFFSSDMKGLTLNNKLVQVELTDIVSELGDLMRKYPLFFACINMFGQKAWDFYPNQYIKQLRKRIDNLLKLSETCVEKRLVAKRDQYLKSSPGDEEVEQDFLDVILKEFVNQKDNDITKDEVVQQFLSLFFAGTDTTSHTVAVVLYQLGVDQEAQNELREEILSLGDKDGNISYEELSKFEKTTAFIKECLRMRSPAPEIIPREVANDHFIKDLFVKKGWFIVLPPLAMNFSDTQFDNAEQFDWRRWLNKDPIKPQPDQQYMFIPFSAGARNCIGQHMAWMESKVIVAHLLRNYRFVVDQTQKVTWKQTFMYSFHPQSVIKVSKI